MLHTEPYKAGEIQHTDFGSGARIYARYWLAGVYIAVKAKSTSHAKMLITRGTK